MRVWPDAKYFDSPNIPLGELTHLLRSKAVLLPGVKVSLVNEKTGDTKTWQYQDGLRGYLSEALAGAELMVPFFEGEQYAGADHENFAEGEGAQWVVAWTEDGNAVRESYVNLIPTPAGGTHESGLREGLFGAVKGFAELHSLLPKGVKLLPEDVFARASFVLSAKVLDPQFQGQIKERLNSRDAVRLVGGFSKSALDLWLHSNVEYGKKLAELAIRQAQARQRSAQKVEKRKSSGVAVLPGKLTDCESSDATRTEVFLVEGDSAGGSAKMGRDKEFQAILPLRGKVLNSWEVDRDRLFANNEIHDISVAIGVDPHGPGDTPDLSGLRYGRICILSDADVDGSHIQVLLLTLFYKHFPKLVEAGNVFVAKPPLFRLDVPAQGKRPARKIYCLDEGELEAAQDKLRKEGVREGAWAVSRFKGLGEMNPEQLWETTMNPDTRRLLPVGYGDQTPEDTTRMFDMLMGKGESSQRRAGSKRRATWRSWTSDGRVRARLGPHGRPDDGRRLRRLRRLRVQAAGAAPPPLPVPSAFRGPDDRGPAGLPDLADLGRNTPNWGRILPVYFQGLAVGLGILALLALAYEYVLPSLVRMNTRRMLKRQPDELFLGRHQLDFGPDGITDTTATASGRMDWSDVRRVEETPQHLYVILGTLQGVIIPKRGQDAATLDAVRTQLRAHVADTQLMSSAQAL